MRPKKALVWLLLGFFLVGEANSAPFGRLRARLRSREQQRANPPAPAAGTPQASAQASSIGGGGITGGGGTPAGGGGASSVGALTDIDNAAAATAGQALTAVGDGVSFTFDDVAGGAGDPIYTPDGTTEITRLPTFNGFDYGVSGSEYASKTSGSVTAGTTVAVDTNHTFLAGQAVAIPGAGDAHALAAVTPTAPTATIGGSSLFYRVSGNIIELLNNKKEGDFLGYGTNFNFTVSTSTDLMTVEVPFGIDNGHPVYVVTSTTLPSVASGTFAAGTAVYPRWVTDLTYSIHPTAADAIAGTNALNFTSTGSGTHTYHVELPVRCYSTGLLPYTAEVQTVTVINHTGSPGGSFTLTCGAFGTTPAINWNASTATVATNIQTQLRTLAGLETVTCTFASGDFTAGAVFTVTFVGAPGNVSQMTSADSLTGDTHSVAHATTTAGTTLVEGDTYYARRDSGSLRRWTLHDTAANAAANAGVQAYTQAGTGFNSLMLTGSTTVNHRVVAISDGGGQTVRSAEGATTLAMPTLKANSSIKMWWPLVDDGAGVYAESYAIYSDRGGTDHIAAVMNGCPNAVKIVMQAGGYTDCVPTDIGKDVRYSSAIRGKLWHYDNTTRTWIVLRDFDGGDTFPASSACTITTLAPNTTSSQTAGEGAGTTTGSPEFVMAWENGGDKDVEYDNRTLALRTGKEVQVFQVSGTPTGGTNSWSYDGYQVSVAYNASAATLQTALGTIPGLEGISVATVGTTPNFTYLVTFQDGSEFGLGDVPQIKVFSSMTGGTPVLSYGTLIQGASYLPGDLVLEPPTSSGVLYECRKAIDSRGGVKGTLTNTLNVASIDGHNLLWYRTDTLYSVSSPSAATADLYLGEVVTASSNSLTVTPATSTTVADDTPVFHDDWPGLKATIEACIAVGGGTVKLSGKSYNCFSRGHAAAEWTAMPGGGTNKALYNFNSPGASIILDLNGGSIWWRATKLPTCTDDVNSPTFTGDTYQFFNFQGLRDFTWRDGDFVCAGPHGESEQNIDNFSFAATASGGNDTDQIGDVRMENAKFYTRSHIGFLSQNGTSPHYSNVELYYGSNGHDAGLREGDFYNCHIEGVGRWRSTPLYTEEGMETPCKSYGTDWVNVGVDGLRIRSANFEMIGGSVHNLHDYRLTTWISLDAFAKNAKVQGVTVNVHGTAGSIGGAGSVFDGNIIRNAGLQVTAANVTITGNNGTTNDWVRNVTQRYIDVQNANCLAVGNTLNGESTVTTAASNTNDGTSSTTGIYLTGASSTGFVAGPNQISATANAIEAHSSFVGTATFSGGRYYSTDLVHNSNNESCRFAAGNGADISISGVTFDSLTKADEVWFGGTSSAKYTVKGCKVLCEMEFDAALTNAANTVEGNDFADATQAVDFADAGTRIINNDFALAPTLTGALLYTRDNRVAGSAITSVALAANQDNYVWPITDTVVFTTTGTNNYAISGVVARAPGSIINVVNGDAADNVTISHDVTSTDANRFNVNVGSDAVYGPDDAGSYIGTGGVNTGWSDN